MEGTQEQSKDAQAPTSEGTGASDVEVRTQQVEQEVVRRETHDRLLKESRSFKERAQAAEAKLKEREEVDLQEQNQFKELYERTKSEAAALVAEKTALLRRVSLEPQLVKAGCVDSATAIQLGNAELLVEDGASLHGVEEYIADLQKSKPYLFASKTPSSVNASVPSGGIKAEAPQTDTSKMSDSDIKARIKQLNRQIRGA